jgi:hypothetical protein
MQWASTGHVARTGWISMIAASGWVEAKHLAAPTAARIIA